MDDRKMLSEVKLSTVFMRFFSGFGAGMVGTIVLGIILLLTWGIVGQVLAPTANQLVEQIGTGIVLKKESHPLFLSIVILAVFLATLISNLSYTLVSSAIEEHYDNRTTNLTQAFLGNLVILIALIPVYLISSNLYGSLGVAITAMTHICLASIFCFLAMELISRTRYLLLSLYGVITGVSLFAILMNLVGSSSPTVLSLMALPLLLGCIGAGSGFSQMFYFWIQTNYSTDVLDSEKRFGDDYGQDVEHGQLNDEDI